MTAFVDAATVTTIGIVSAIEYTRGFVPQQFRVGDTSATAYVRAGRPNIVTINALDNNATFQFQASPEGETWYNVINGSYAVVAGSPIAFEVPTSIDFYRVKCTVAALPAICIIGTQGGY